MVYVPQVGIDGLLHVAARDHKDYDSFSEPEYGPMIDVTWIDRNTKKAKTFKAPEWARIAAFKKGSNNPTVAKVWWEEIYRTVDDSPMVRRMPRLMLAKCAKAQATRSAYPETGGLYVPEESQGREYTSITPGGRLISEDMTLEHGSAEAAKALGERKAAAGVEGRKAEIAARNAEEPAKTDTPTPQPGDLTVEAKSDAAEDYMKAVIEHGGETAIIRLEAQMDGENARHCI